MKQKKPDNTEQGYPSAPEPAGQDSEDIPGALQVCDTVLDAGENVDPTGDTFFAENTPTPAPAPTPTPTPDPSRDILMSGSELPEKTEREVIINYTEEQSGEDGMSPEESRIDDAQNPEQSQTSPDKLQTGILGTVLDSRYRILDTIGEGGMGMVVRGHDMRLETEVAVKVLHSDLLSEESQRTRFKNEAKTLAALGNPHIVNVIDINETPEGKLYFVMEFIRGDSLSGVLEKNEGPFTWMRAAEIILQICDAMQAAHDEGIVHRDLKPENILLDSKTTRLDFVKILDFGIAKDIKVPNSNLTATGMVFGTPGYLSPEQARGQTVDHRVDIFQFGIIMYELLTGTGPFEPESDSLADIIVAHLTGDPIPLLEANPNADIDADIEAMVMKCLEKNPDDRFQSMNDLAATVRRIKAKREKQSPTILGMEGLVPLGHRTAGISREIHKFPVTIRRLILGLGIGVVLVGGGGLWYLMSDGQSPKKYAKQPLTSPDPDFGKRKSPDTGMSPRLDALAPDSNRPDSIVNKPDIGVAPPPPDKRIRKKPKIKNGTRKPRPKVKLKPGELPEDPGV